MFKKKKTSLEESREKTQGYANSSGSMIIDRQYKKTEDNNFGGFYSSEFPSKSFNEFDNYIKNLKKGSVLDVGAGGGSAAGQIHDIYPGIKVMGVDLKPNKKVGMVKGDAEHLPFKDNTFDGAISCKVMQYVPDKLEAIAEIYRVLKPSGKAIVTVNEIYDQMREKDIKHRKYLMSQGEYNVDKIRNPVKKFKFKRNQLKKILGKEADIEINGDTIVITKNHDKLEYEGKYELQDVVNMRVDDLEQNYPIYKRKSKTREKIISGAKKIKERLKNILCIF